MATLYVYMGFPCTGKTTHAKTKNIPIVDVDEVRKSLTGQYETLDDTSDLVADVVYKSVRHYLSKGMDVLVEGLFLSVHSRRLFAELAQSCGANAEIHWFDPSFSWIFEKIKEPSYGKPHVTPAYIQRLSRHFDFPTVEEGFSRFHYYCEQDFR